ncbi:MAG: restriction endonuclease subunit S [Planctomycetaceae bacterium]|nr:restriction endonuclease subunit S [Planctomycetaceae bacterium]
MKTPLPSGWKECTLGSLFKVKHGYAFDGKFFAAEGDYILLTPGNFFDQGGFKLKDKEKFFIGDIPSDYVLNKGDLIVAMTEQAEGLLGSSAIIPSSNRFLHNQRLGLISDWHPDEIDICFLYFLFNTQSVRQQIRAAATGTKVRHTSPTRIGDVKVRIPSVATQRKIAGILSAYSDLIKNNTRRVAILEEMAQAIYREWFVHFRFPGHENAKFVDSPLGRIPEGWRIATLDEVCVEIIDSEHKTAPLQDEGFPSIRTPNIGRGHLLLENVRRVSESTYEKWTRRAIPQTGDLILAREAPVGNVAIIPERETVCLGQRTVLIRANADLMNPHYLLRTLLDDRCQSVFSGASSGATVAHLNLRDIRTLKIVVASSEVLMHTASLLEPLHQQIANSLLRNRKLRNSLDLLLPKLISGQLDVETLDIDIGESLEVAA